MNSVPFLAMDAHYEARWAHHGQKADL